MKPTIAQYAAALHAAFQEVGDAGVDQVVHNFIRVLEGNGDLGLYPDVITAFEQLVSTPERGGPAVTFGRPQHLTTAEADALNKLAATSGPVREAVSDALLGGVVVRVDDTVVDASVAGSLSRMRTFLSEE